MNKHTPAPWNLQTNTVNYRSGIKALQVRGTSNELLATFPGCDRDKANARLIAAAPELLEALEPFGAIDLIESRLPAEFAMLVLRARAAIAKATGE